MKKLFIILGLTAICFGMSQVNYAQTADSSGEALRVLKAALNTFGGEAGIKSLKSIFVHTKGVEHRSAEAQGYDPEKETTAADEEKLAVFMDNIRLAYEYRIGRHDGTERWRRIQYVADGRIVADFGERDAFFSPVRYPSPARTQAARSIPHVFLLEVLAAPASLKYLGVRNYENREHEVISWQTPAAKAPVLFYFDKQTGLLAKYEFTTDFPGLGNSTVEYTFSDYREHPQLKWFPAGRAVRVNGKIYRTLTYQTVAVNSPAADAMLELPPELEGLVAAPGTVKEIAKGVYLVYRLGGYQPMFIEFKDFVLAIEAPAAHPSLDDVPVESLASPTALSEQLIDIIRKTVKDKPIKYFVATHSHSDHAGGTPAFVAAGATVLTTPGNKTFFEKLITSGLKIEIFDNKKIISDGERTVELLNVKANPHTAENVVVYLPQEKYLYQGDLFYFDTDSNFPSRGRMTVMPFFANWLKENKLSPARIYGFHSVSFATMEHVEKLRAMKLKT